MGVTAGEVLGVKAPGAGLTVRLPIMLLDSAGAVLTGVAFNAAGMSVQYAKEGASAFSAFPTFDTNNWNEIGLGNYDVILRQSDADELALLNTEGHFRLYVKCTASRGDTFLFKVNVADAARDDQWTDAKAAYLDVALTTIANRIGAWTGSARNTILGAFQALFRKDADATVPSDVNADLGGGAGVANNTTDSTEALRDRGDAAWGAAAGAGDLPVVVTVTDASGNGLRGAKVTARIASTDAEYCSGYTLVTGIVTLNLQSDTAHKIMVVLTGYTFSGSPYSLAAGTATLTCPGTQFAAAAPTDPSLCTVCGWVKDHTNAAISGATVTAKPSNPPFYTTTGLMFSADEVSTTTNSEGYWTLTLPRSASVLHKGTKAGHWTIKCEETGFERTAVIPDESTKCIDDLTFIGT